MALSFDQIAPLFATKGLREYAGEGVSQLDHALQAATLAEGEGAAPALEITAALLHDLGHMLNDQGDTPTLRGVDDLHQYAALPFLKGLFDDAVLQPIRLHVDAKRYLCATRPDYYAALSADSQRSLLLQGGVFSAGEAASFIAQPYAGDAVCVRIWDDSAKASNAVTPPLAHFLAIAQSVAISA